MDWLLPAVRPVPPLYAVRVAPNAKKGTGRGNSRAVESGAPDERHVADGKSVVLAPLLVSSRRKTCRPYRARTCRQFAGDGGKTNSSPGRARHNP